MKTEELLSFALDIGEEMLLCGAEIHRVEECIDRIGKAYRAQRTDVFAVNSVIIVTLVSENGESATLTRRIRQSSVDLERLDRFNSLSREICATRPEADWIREKIAALRVQKTRYPQKIRFFAYLLIAFSFAMFFEGSWKEAVLSAAVAALLYFFQRFQEKMAWNPLLVSLVSSFYMCVLSMLFARIFSQPVERIIIGNIMILIPGVALTTSLRDMVVGDSISGLLRFFEACMSALAIAGGYWLACLVFGGAV